MPRRSASTPSASRPLAAAAVTPFGVLLGLAVPWFMQLLKQDEKLRATLAWMWGVSAAANVIGSLMFVPLCRQLGVQATFALAGGLYVAALLWAAFGPAIRRGASAAPAAA